MKNNPLIGILAVLLGLAHVSAQAATISVSTTITIAAGTFDGQGNTYVSAGLECSAEGCPRPMFRVENGATLKNLTIDGLGNDGVWMLNGATLENVKWTRTDPSGNGVSVRQSAGRAQEFKILGGSAKGIGTEPLIHVTARATVIIRNFSADGFTTFLRQDGGSPPPCVFRILDSKLSNGTYGIRTDDATTTIDTAGTTFTNVRTPVRRR